jgi:sorbitol-specific phosphotransferase system component IIC
MSDIEATTETADSNSDNSISHETKWVIELFKGLGKVLNDVGIAGFIVIAIVIFVFFFTDKSHKDEIIDAWFLFKTGNSQFIIIVFLLIIMLFAQQIHYKRVIAMKQERINELANKKNSEYSKKIGLKLSASHKPKKP